MSHLCYSLQFAWHTTTQHYCDSILCLCINIFFFARSCCLSFTCTDLGICVQKKITITYGKLNASAKFQVQECQIQHHRIWHAVLYTLHKYTASIRCDIHLRFGPNKIAKMTLQINMTARYTFIAISSQFWCDSKNHTTLNAFISYLNAYLLGYPISNFGFILIFIPRTGAQTKFHWKPIQDKIWSRSFTFWFPIDVQLSLIERKRNKHSKYRIQVPNASNRNPIQESHHKLIQRD